MKRITISLCILGFALTAKAQVGVNTTNPRGIFNVDGSQNNTNTTVPATVVAESKDDVVVEAGGNVGIGTSDPTVKLEIQTGGTATAPVAGVKIVDGTQGLGKVLTSDTNGNATWGNTVVTAFANSWTSYAGVFSNPFNGINGSGLPTGITVTIPEKGWYFFRTGIDLYSACNDYSLYINGIGDVWKSYCGGGTAYMVPRDQTRVLYFATPGTYSVLGAKTHSIVPTMSANPTFYLDFVKFQN